MTKAIGFVGGLGPGATIQYYRDLTRGFGERGLTPPFFITHADALLVSRLVSEGAIEDLSVYLSQQIASLARAGAEFATISAVLPHICAPRLKQMIDLPLLDLIDCIADELEARGVRRIAILGTRYVMQTDLYGRLQGYDVVRPSQDVIDFTHEHYVRIVRAGSVAGSGADIEGLRNIAQDLVHRQGAELVVLAATDLSLAFDEASCGFPALDCTRLHVRAILDLACGVTPPGP